MLNTLAAIKQINDIVASKVKYSGINGMSLFSFILTNPMASAKLEIKNGAIEKIRSNKLFAKINVISENKLIIWIAQGPKDKIDGMIFFLR